MKHGHVDTAFENYYNNNLNPYRTFQHSDEISCNTSLALDPWWLYNQTRLMPFLRLAIRVYILLWNGIYRFVTIRKLKYLTKHTLHFNPVCCLNSINICGINIHIFLAGHLFF